MIRRLAPLFLLASLLAAAPARGEEIQLLDNTRVSGKILHFYDGVFQIEAAGGQKIDLPREKIKSITFKLPPPRVDFSSPEKTFARWRDALAKGEQGKVIDCYALMYQGMLAAQLGQSPDDFKKMQKDIEGTRFDVKGTKVTGDTANIKVQRTKGEDVMTAEIHLVQENGEWKMTP
ncbi:MAG: hypothetical protein EXR72_09840 [Myxococcales bacterium]|nr:hypothetical protein [Myxococcales bacterium]